MKKIPSSVIFDDDAASDWKENPKNPAATVGKTVWKTCPFILGVTLPVEWCRRVRHEEHYYRDVVKRKEEESPHRKRIFGGVVVVWFVLRSSGWRWNGNDANES